MSEIGERVVTGGNGRNPQTEKSRYVLVMEAFWPGDKCRIRAVSEPTPQPVQPIFCSK